MKRDDFNQGEERRQQTSDIIDELLGERRRMWALYCSVAGLEPFTRHQSVENSLKEFCQILMDYISLGHFGIYRRITEGGERRKKVLEVVEQTYPRITESTEYAVGFNDKYEKMERDRLTDHLAADLSLLGEKLAARIDLEDRLIASLIH